MSGSAMVGVLLMKTPRDAARSCTMSGSSPRAAGCWLSQAGWAVVYAAHADRMAERKASLGTLLHSSGLVKRLPCTPLKLSILAAKNQLCIKLPLLISGAMHHSLRRLRLFAKGGFSAIACS